MLPVPPQLPTTTSFPPASGIRYLSFFVENLIANFVENPDGQIDKDHDKAYEEGYPASGIWVGGWLAQTVAARYSEPRSQLGEWGAR